jgi:hypothetical protein
MDEIEKLVKEIEREIFVLKENINDFKLMLDWDEGDLELQEGLAFMEVELGFYSK